MFLKWWEGRKLPDADHDENHDKLPELPLPEHKAGLSDHVFQKQKGRKFPDAGHGDNHDKLLELPLQEPEAGLPDHVFRKCEEGRKLPDAGHGENEDKEPELTLSEHDAGLPDHLFRKCEKEKATWCWPWWERGQKARTPTSGTRGRFPGPRWPCMLHKLSLTCRLKN